MADRFPATMFGLGRFTTSLVLCCLVHIVLVRADDEVHATDLLQQKYLLHQNCGFAPGIHLVKLPKLKRQFAFVVPRGRVESSRGAPVFMFFHGVYQTPWFSINILGLPDMLERYGWFGILPFGMHLLDQESMGGLRQCCSDLCHADECCLDAKNITSKGAAACGFYPPHLDKNLEMIDAIFQWMTSLGCIDTSKVFAGGFSYGGTIVQDLACVRSWQFWGLAPDVAPGDYTDRGLLHLGDCKNATPVTYISFCGTGDISHCYFNSIAKAETVAKQTHCCSRSELRRKSATVNCTVWSGCHAGHVVESCMVYRMDHEIPGRVAPDGTSFLHPGSDLDYTKYVFEKFSLQVASDQLRFYGHPTQAEEDWKQEVWPPNKMYDSMYLRTALATQGLQTLPNQRVSITSTIEYEG